jgi:3-methylcrotonyl-CoA carboxylase alpha subunit
MLEKLLIANRGEIACRVARTARRMGIATVAVYSEADAHALHVSLADEAWPIGPAQARESYLSIDKIIDAARQSQAQAIHPGYGFLAENPKFAERCTQAGMIFVGPTAVSMRLIGSKASAKALMERIGVPTAPGYHGDATDVATILRVARDIGFPVLIKASAGGGGRGMRIVQSPEDLAAAMEAAEREALASFGDGRLLLEKYLARSRHIEIQIFADKHGGVVSFPERDCSLQRRHQKILEETPALGISESLRQGMRSAAIEVARTVGYVGAGTVEFLLDGDRFYFLEMNTRLQVEHPITEMISGQDLVEWQLRIACGEKLPLTQGELIMQGWAIEARVCAEDPAMGFLPSIGEIKHLRLPERDSAIRVDTGVKQGDWITQYYDSLIAKVIVWGEDRQEALRRMGRALSSFELVGLETNLDLLRALVSDPSFATSAVDTLYVENSAIRLIANAPLTEFDERCIVASLSFLWLAHLRRKEQERSAKYGDQWSPWSQADGWRIDREGYHDLVFDFDGLLRTERIWPRPDGDFRLGAFPTSVEVDAEQEGDRLSLRVSGVKREVGVTRDGNAVIVIMNGRNYVLTPIDPLRSVQGERGARMEMSAPIPARVIALHVDVGDRVKAGAPLVVLEAMKMEITLRSPRDAVIADVRCAVGELTPEGAELIVLAEDEP